MGFLFPRFVWFCFLFPKRRIREKKESLLRKIKFLCRVQFLMADSSVRRRRRNASEKSEREKENAKESYGKIRFGKAKAI